MIEYCCEKGLLLQHLPPIAFSIKNLTCNINNLHYGVEFEYTTASHGELQPNTFGDIINNKNISNLRINFSAAFDL